MSVLARILYFIFFSFLNSYFNSQGFGLAATIVFILAFVAVVLAMINVVGGFMVTNRMLNMIAGKKRGGA